MIKTLLLLKIPTIPIAIWDISAYSLAVVFVVSFLLLRVFRFIKNRYLHSYHKDELISNTKTVNSHNKLYFTSGETLSYIKKYVISKTLYNKFLICNYNNNYKRISYWIYQYNSHKRVIDVMHCIELNTSSASKVIALKKRCKYVNILINSVDGDIINSNAIIPISRSRINWFAFLRFWEVFSFLYVIRHFAVKFICMNYDSGFFGNVFNWYLIGAAFITALLVSVFSSVKLHGRNKNAGSGGVLEYEFI